MIKLARLEYKAQKGETVVDITVKNNPKHVLAPTWELVMNFKKGMLWSEYTGLYLQLLRERWIERSEEFRALARLAKTQTVVFVCFCTNENLCHRSIAKVVIETIMEAL